MLWFTGLAAMAVIIAVMVAEAAWPFDERNKKTLQVN